MVEQKVFTRPSKYSFDNNMVVNNLGRVEVKIADNSLMQRSIRLAPMSSYEFTPGDYFIATEKDEGLIAILLSGISIRSTDDYNQLLNKPSINGELLIGNKTSEDLGIASSADLGNLNQLITSDKTSIVNAINDVAIQSQQAVSLIGDQIINGQKEFILSPVVNGSPLATQEYVEGLTQTATQDDIEGITI